MVRCLSLLILLPACAAARPALREDLSPSPCAVVLAKPCTLRGDFDGDGSKDKARIVQSVGCTGEDCPNGIALSLHSGEVLVLGLRPGTWEWVELDGSTPTVEPISVDFSWIESWETLVKQGDSVAVQVLGTAETLALPGLVGDAIYLSSSDTAVVIYPTPSGWRVYPMGF